MRLLIAEDDKSLGLFLSRGMEADGHRVRLVFDGGAAVEAFRQEMPDLTILDLNLPVKDGEQVLTEVRALDADLPVIVLTARAAGLCCGASARRACNSAPAISNSTVSTTRRVAAASRWRLPTKNLRCSSISC